MTPLSRFFLGAFSLISVGASSCFATVTLQIQVANVYQASGALIPNGAIGVLVADTTGNGFVTGQSGFANWAGTTLSVGQSVSGSSDDKILAVFTANNSLSTGMGFSSTPTLSLTGGVAAGQAMELVWFPTLSTIGGVVPANLTEMGFYTNASVGISGGNTAFVVPADSTSKTLAYFDSSVQPGSGVSPSQLTAITATAAPEPSRLMLTALGLGTFLIRRRRVA